MQKVSKIGVNNLIQSIKEKSKFNKYYQPQIEIIDNDKKSDFLNFCDKLSDYKFVDELGKKSNLSRYRIDKELKDVIFKAHTSIACGIKVVLNPLMSLSKWDKWEDGYIEVFARMDSDEKYVEWFVWQYIKMNKLSTILSEFQNDIYLL